jgi:hypothetical protein
MSILSGAEYKARFPNTTFYHLGTEYDTHIVTTGLNVIPSAAYSLDGLYVTEENKIALWIDQPMKYIRKAILPDDATVYIEKDAFKCDRLILEERILLKNCPLWTNPDFCKLSVQQNGLALQYVVNQTDELCQLAVQQTGDALQYVLNQTDELCKLAIQNDRCYAIQWVKNQTLELCTLAVQQNAFALRFANIQTDELCRFAVEQDWTLLEFVKHQTDELCKLAIEQNGCALQYVLNQTDELCKLAVQQNGFVLQYVINQTDELRRLAMEQTGFATHYVDCTDQTDEWRRLLSYENFQQYLKDLQK